MIYDVFISYSRKDLKQVVAIRDEIKEKLGAESWIDIKGIESGEQFVNVIIQAIDGAKVVLFMISESSMRSEYTKKEIMYAKNVGKKVVPVILDGSRLSGWFLFEFGTVDYVDINNALQKRKFHENLRSWLGLDNNGQGPQSLSHLFPGHLVHHSWSHHCRVWEEIPDHRWLEFYEIGRDKDCRFGCRSHRGIHCH